jgi:NodT family efflux transporter outer membrane factor (OMF) lipoprotein
MKSRIRGARSWLWLSIAQRLIFAGTISALFFAGGCVVGPKYQRPNVDIPAAFKEAAPVNVSEDWKPAQPQDDASRGRWWLVFNDPELNGLEDKALATNQNIAAAASNFLAARALVRQARSQYYPTIGTSPSILNSRPSSAQFGGLKTSNGASTGFTLTSFNQYSLPFDASWEPDLWGRVRNNVRANTFAAQASAADLENVRLSETAELAADYYQLRAQDSLKQLFDATVAAYQESLELTQNLYKAELSSDEAVAQAEAQLKAAQAQDTNLGVLRAQYEHAIAVLIGQAPAGFSLAAESMPIRVPSVPAGIPAVLLQRRPDIAAAERNVAAANAQIGVAKAAYYPNLTLSATGGFGTSTFASWLEWPSRFWSVGPAVAETIFDGGLRRATMEQYRATYDTQVANYRETVLTAFQQVEDNLVAIRILAEDIELQDGAVDAAQRSLNESMVRYRAGLDPYLNVISAQTVLLSDQQTAVGFREQQFTATVQLVKALGGGWDVGLTPLIR